MPISHTHRGTHAPIFPLLPEHPVPSQSTMSDGIIMVGPKVPGTRCPTCALDGKEVWVIPGRCCGYCGTPCD
ncbi:uncharacterized protein TRIVIDRAFT_214226 [Trichoderma virens Gv29-8]|uniref:Uncharacterized protein n=1 Tax=Hypocrea virens (strain Gv29-8 / FGSC 10586) TaxID=413071 RepID=G9N7J0_HYPVG|nr:uncharacterized protein TRIVIDRAFT_214226 [Trichoderma virens Gv29-8]EHK16956.1 hypothetical protein TRIVIDRAFT_214226 [Trichoderma virens Gv29-8]UKZ55369.1 hypothetical protein TrVGV298_009191 [Trichoderma virens]UKZ81139.1 hypothetical protein TrVFT333_008909 [Trichoderma virens FT-333]